MTVVRRPDGSPGLALACLLADGDEHVLAALGSYLSAEGVNVLGSARSGVDVLSLLLELPSVAVVADLHLHDLSGLDVVRGAAEIMRQKTPVILYTDDASPRRVREALDAGARAVLMKGGDPQALLVALTAVSAGTVYVDPRLERSRGETRS
jgi:DNA-binding NarL/FixJ family response regulator